MPPGRSCAGSRKSIPAATHGPTCREHTSAKSAINTSPHRAPQIDLQADGSWTPKSGRHPSPPAVCRLGAPAGRPSVPTAGILSPPGVQANLSWRALRHQLAGATVRFLPRETGPPGD